MKTHTFIKSNNTSAVSSHRVPKPRHMFTTPNHETMQVQRKRTNNVEIIDHEKRRLREHEYHSRVHITDLDIPTAAFFPDLDVDDEDFVSSTAWATESTSLLPTRRLNTQALRMDTHQHDHNDRIDSETVVERDSGTDSDNEIIHILSSVPRLKLKRRTMITNSKDTHPHIIPEGTKDSDNK